jgi:hypothetical protein
MRWVRALVLCSLIVTTAPAQGSDQTEAANMTIRLISIDVDSKVLTDRAPTNEASRGDVIVVESRLRNAVAQFGRPKGAVVGRNTWVFTIRTPTSAHLILESRLLGGGLQASGRVRLGARQTFPITGGTGRFANSRGAGESVALANRQGQGNRRLVVYRLVSR